MYQAGGPIGLATSALLLPFPYDFGYIPGTVAADGDPLDVLVLMDAPAFCGCGVECRLVGVLEAQQRENGRSIRNDRLIGVANAARDYGDLQALEGLNSHLLEEIEQFFVSYNAAEGKRFRILARKGPSAARKLLREARTS